MSVKTRRPAAGAPRASVPIGNWAPAGARSVEQTARGFGHYAELFNRDLKVIIRDVASRYPDDATIYRAEKRVMTAIDIDPLYVIDLVGKYLYTYREQIYALEAGGTAAESFFLDSDYDTEMRAGVNREKIDLVNYIMPKVKECVRSLEPDEKQDYKERIVGLLDNYVEYLAALHGK